MVKKIKFEEKMKQQTNISDESVIKSLRKRGIDERSIAGEDELAKANKLDKISATSVECLNKVCDRMDLIEFINLDAGKQKHVLKSCVLKTRLEDVRAVSMDLIDKFNKKNVALNFYGCEYCGGYHLTGVGKNRRTEIEKMIIKLKGRLEGLEE